MTLAKFISENGTVIFIMRKFAVVFAICHSFTFFFVSTLMKAGLIGMLRSLTGPSTTRNVM